MNRTVRLFGFLVVVPLLGACGDSATAPVTELRIESVTPRLFAVGDVVEVRGPGVDRAEIRLDGASVEVIDRSSGKARFRAPADVPTCRTPLPTLYLTVVAGNLRDSTRVSTLGRPVDVSLDVGEHRVLPEVGAGCVVSLAHGGTYGVALYRTATVPVNNEERGTRVSVQARLEGGVPRGAAMPAPVAAGPWTEALPTPSDVPPPPSVRRRGGARADEASCVRTPSAVGDRLALASPYRPDTVQYEVTSVSPHYAILVQEDSLRHYDATRRAFVSDFAGALEEQVQPYLERLFEAWPDADGDGRLNVLFSDETGAFYPGGFGIYPDGCAGDFITFSHSYTAKDLDNALGTVVHEATHWYDIGPDLARMARMEDWSIEAVANTARIWWQWEREGRSLDGNYGVDCDPGTTCYRQFLDEDRYGLPGLSPAGGYTHGMYLTWYLIQQAVGGGSPLQALGHLRYRAPGKDVVSVGPIFALAGGTDRSEEELQGEYLLSFYADDYVPGISPRLMEPSWDLTANGPHYPLRAFVLDASHTEEAVPLARPDGIVFEVWTGADALLSFAPTPAGLAMAVVRAR